jgi:hypothetical protein
MHKAVENTHRRDDYILSPTEFRAALRHVAKTEHYPFLVLHADNLVCSRYIGGLVYEGAHIFSWATDATQSIPVLTLSLDSPEHAGIRDTNIRSFTPRGRTCYWNGGHVLTAGFHHVVACCEVPQPEWLQEAIKDFPSLGQTERKRGALPFKEVSEAPSDEMEESFITAPKLPVYEPIDKRTWKEFVALMKRQALCWAGQVSKQCRRTSARHFPALGCFGPKKYAVHATNDPISQPSDIQVVEMPWPSAWCIT